LPSAVSHVQAPDVPRNLVAGRDEQVDLSWSRFGGFVKGYDIYRPRIRRTLYEDRSTESRTAVTCTDTDVSNGTRYYYHVVALAAQTIRVLNQTHFGHAQFWRGDLERSFIIAFEHSRTTAICGLGLRRLRHLDGIQD